MNATTTLPPSYFALVQKFPLRQLKDDADLDAAIAVADRLIDKETLDAGEEEYLVVLGDLIHNYEAEHDPLPDLNPVNALQFLISENELTQAQLAEQTGVAVATISEILNRKRTISPGVRKALADRFKVHPSLFA